MTPRGDTEKSAELTPSLVEAIAQRVAELLRAELIGAERLLTPSEVADRFAVSRAWVYEHASELGAIRLGDGPRGRLRFDGATIADALDRARPSSNDAHVTDALGGPLRPVVGRGLLPIYGTADGQ